MTIQTRNRMRLLFLCFSSLIVLFAVFSYLFAFIKEAYISLPENMLYSTSRSHLAYSPIAVSTVALAFSVASFAFALYVYFAFKKIQSDEIFFFEVFLFSISWEALRLLPPLFLFSSGILVELASISRILYFFRFLALFSLLSMSLFSIKPIARQKFFIMFLLVFLSLMLSMAEVFDSTQINPLFLSGSSVLSKTYIIIFIAFSIFILSTISLSYVYNSIAERLHIIGGAISLILGYFAMLIFYDYVFTFLGLFLFLYGIANIIRNIHAIYLWQ